MVMKKSNALMFSYIAFLVISLIANIAFKWEGLGKIAFAATIAGCFFAFADLANWYVSFNLPIVEAFLEDYYTFREYYNTAIDYLSTKKQNLCTALEMLRPFREKHEGVEKCALELLDYADTMEERIQSLKDSLPEIEEIEDEIKKEIKNINKFSIIEFAFIVLGFIAFFTVCNFEKICQFILTYNDIATILAFTLIMLNYFLRDILDEKAKEELSTIHNHIKIEQANIEDTKQKYQTIDYVAQAEKLVELAKELELRKAELSEKERKIYAYN